MRRSLRPGKNCRGTPSKPPQNSQRHHTKPAPQHIRNSAAPTGTKGASPREASPFPQRSTSAPAASTRAIGTAATIAAFPTPHRATTRAPAEPSRLAGDPVAGDLSGLREENRLRMSIVRKLQVGGAEFGQRPGRVVICLRRGMGLGAARSPHTVRPCCPESARSIP